MAYFISLVVFLAAVWLGLSGHYNFPIIHMGIGALIFTVWFSMRLGIIDRETSPYVIGHRLIAYWVWLMGEIVKANVTVIRAILKAEPDIEPALVKVKTRCQTDLARVVFANSITLTPGTVTVDLEKDELTVHALNASEATPGAFDEMDIRSGRAVDGRRAMETTETVTG